VPEQQQQNQQQSSPPQQAPQLLPPAVFNDDIHAFLDNKRLSDIAQVRRRALFTPHLTASYYTPPPLSLIYLSPSPLSPAPPPQVNAMLHALALDEAFQADLHAPYAAVALGCWAGDSAKYSAEEKEAALKYVPLSHPAPWPAHYSMRVPA